MTNSDLVSTPDECCWLSSPQPLGKHGSNVQSPIVWEDPTSFSSTRILPQHDCQLAEEDLAQVIAAERSFQPGPHTYISQSSKRRKLSPALMPVSSLHSMCVTSTVPMSKPLNFQCPPRYCADSMPTVWQISEGFPLCTKASPNTSMAYYGSPNHKNRHVQEQDCYTCAVENLGQMECKEREYARQQLKAIDDWLNEGLPSKRRRDSTIRQNG